MVASGPGWLWDQDADGIDDRIQQVVTDGISAALEQTDALVARKRIAVRQGDDQLPVFGVYVGYDRHPTVDDLARLRSSGVGTQVLHAYRYIDYVRMELTYAEIQQVAALPHVTRVEAIPMVYSTNDVAAATGGVFDATDEVFPSVREHLGLTGRDVVVSILDTGVNDEPDAVTGYPGHASLMGRFVAGGEFFTGQPALNTAIDDSNNPIDRGEEAASVHGTHVAGTAVGFGRPNGLFRGMAPEALFVDQKVLSDAGLGFGSADGVEWAIANKDQYDIRVLNLSLGTLDESDGTDASSQMINAAFDAGLIPVIAMGNDGQTGYVSSPAAADKALAIGSYSDQNSIERADDLISDFSNEGPRDDDGTGSVLPRMKPLVAAPGSGIISADGSLTTDGNQYKSLGGTSMATPGVAGIVALLLEAKPDLTPAEVVEVLKHTSDHRKDWGKTAADAVPFPEQDPNYHPSGGWGRINAYAAAKEVLRMAGDPASQVQVIRIQGQPAEDGTAAIDVRWVSQREIGLTGYNIYRAPDVDGAPGSFEQLNTELIPGTGSPDIEGLANRNVYSFTDSDGLSFGQVYWYQIEHVSTAGTFQEPAYAVVLGETLPVARLRYSITHNAMDNDLLITLGSGMGQDNADVVVFGKPSGEADQVTEVPGDPTVGNMRYDFSITLTNRDVASEFMPPTVEQPWYLSVSEGGFVNRTGQVDAFAIDLFDETGAIVETLETSDPTPERLVEGQTVELWIPADPTELTLGAAPLVTDMSPEGVSQGATDVSVTVTGSQFQPMASLSVDGEGVTLTGVETDSVNRISASMSVAMDAPPGPRAVTVTNVDGQSDTLEEAFTVILAGQDPTPDEPTDEPSDGDADPDTPLDPQPNPPQGSGGVWPVTAILIMFSFVLIRRRRALA